jgi:thiamine-phosphate pyrophosphorylase
VLLINSRTDIALAVGAGGVHLRSNDIAASEARAIWGWRNRVNPPSGNARFVAAVSCHTTAEVRLAEAHGADFAVFSPVFEKASSPSRPGAGLDSLRDACCCTMAAPNVEGVGAGRMPVLALGGVTLANAQACLATGAAGIAAIRLFQECDVTETIDQLRALPASVDYDHLTGS